LKKKLNFAHTSSIMLIKRKNGLFHQRFMKRFMKKKHEFHEEELNFKLKFNLKFSMKRATLLLLSFHQWWKCSFTALGPF